MLNFKKEIDEALNAPTPVKHFIANSEAELEEFCERAKYYLKQVYIIHFNFNLEE